MKTLTRTATQRRNSAAMKHTTTSDCWKWAEVAPRDQVRPQRAAMARRT